MSQLSFKSYEKFKESKFDNFIGENINSEIIQDLWGINRQTTVNPRLLNFKKTYNLAYLGEVLERYEERGIVKTNEDLRALLAYTSYSYYYEYPNTNTNQVEIFIKKVEKIASSNRDIFSIAILLQRPEFIEHLVDDKNLCSIVIEEVKNNANLSFEEKVWAIYSCWNYLNSRKEFSSSENSANQFGNVETLVVSNCVRGIRESLLSAITTIEIKSLKHLDDYYLYLMLIKMINKETFLQTSKNFKNKVIANQFKKLISLAKKEYKDETVDSLISVLNIRNEDIFVYNFLLSHYSYMASIETKVTSKGDMRLLQKIIGLLSKPEKCHSIVYDIINNKLISISEERDSSRSSSYYSAKKGMQKAREIIFEDFDGEVSVANFEIFAKLTGINERSSAFFHHKKYGYVLKDEYKEHFEKLHCGNQRDMAADCLYRSSDKEIVKKAYDYIIFKNLEHYLSRGQYKNLYALGVLNLNNISECNNLNRMEGRFAYLSEILSDEDFLKELKSFYNNIDSMECSINGHIGKYEFVSTYTNLIMELLSDKEILKSLMDKDKDLAREYQSFRDTLYLLYCDKFNYFGYIINMLDNNRYIELMELTEEDIYKVRKDIYTILQEDNSKRDDYSVSRMLTNLENKILTEKEKEEREIKKHLESLSERAGLYNIHSSLQRDFAKNNREYVLKVKEIYFNLLNEKDTFRRYSFVIDIFEIAKELENLGELTDDDILKISKKCLEHL